MLGAGLDGGVDRLQAQYFASKKSHVSLVWDLHQDKPLVTRI